MSNKLRQFRITRYAIAIMVILAFIYFGIIPYIFGGKKMETFCGQLAPGMQSKEVYELIAQTDYKYLENKGQNPQTIIIIDSEASGRFICEVAIHQDKVIDASYAIND